MKKICIWAASILLLLLSGCFKDDRNNFMVPDSFGIASKGGLLDASVHTGMCTVGIVKSGKGLSAAKVHVNRSPEVLQPLLDQWNRDHGTNYVTMSSLIDAEQAEFSFTAEEVVKDLVLRWDPDLVARAMGHDDNFVIPVLIESDDPEVKVNPDRSFVLVRLTRSGVELKQSTQTRSIERKSVESGILLSETLTLDFAIDHPIKGVEMRFPIKVDNSLIAGFNASQETQYTAAPDGLVTLLDQEVTLPAGALSGIFKVQLDKSVLLQGGKLADFPPYVVPICVQQEGIRAARNQESVDLKGLSFGNMVCYLTVIPAAKGISAVTREWGLYSDAGAWYRDLEGFATDADRSIAMDKDYVYVAHSAATPVIYALSRTSGSFVKKLDIGPAAGNGCTFPVSCVRMIPNENGDPILAFCSLKGEDAQHLRVYAYKDGPDAAPVQILDYLLDKKPAPGVNDFRRYGDRFTVEGTWQDGRLWFHTWNADGANRGKTVVFTLRGGEVTNPDDPQSYLIDGTAGDLAAIREVVRYPGWDDVLVTRRNGAGIFRITGNDSDNGWIKWNKLQDVPEYALTYGYQFFEFHEEHFIAYMQLDAENGLGGRLVIVDDHSATPADFPAQLQAQGGRREFPIQHHEDFSAQSGVPAGSSVGDCAFCEVNGNTYIAVLMQGCGLSLFQLQ